MIFPNLMTDDLVQVDDKLRLDASSSFASKDETAISLVRVQPSAADPFIEVFNSANNTDRLSRSFLDWQYSTDGTSVVTVEVTTDGAPVTKSFNVEVITAETDSLLSDDSDLTELEPDILSYLPDGRSSYKYVHRASKVRILEYLDEQRIWDRDGNKLTAADLFDKEEFRAWSKYETLMQIFESNSNAVGDIFDLKMAKYRSKMEFARNRGAIRLDLDNDGIEDKKKDLRSYFMVRR